MEDNRKAETLDAGNGTSAARRGEPIFNLPGIITLSLLILIAIQALLSLAAFLAPASRLDEYIYFYGGFISARYSAAGMSADFSWLWTPVTYSLLHGGWQHLIFNSVWLAIFGSPVARRIGTFRYVLFWILTAIISALAFFAFDPSSQSLLVGASGVISAFTGAACRFVWSPRRRFGTETGRSGPLLSIGEALSNRSVLSFVVVWFLANVVFAALSPVGATMAVAWQAHLGGFIAGFLLFPLFDRS